MDATLALPLLYGLIAVALLFDFLNGLHDAANSIATFVSTRVLRPQYAVDWAALSTPAVGSRELIHGFGAQGVQGRFDITQEFPIVVLRM